jgi:hypothetical protein
MLGQLSRVLIVHLVDGCNNGRARAWSVDPYAVTCRACLRTRHYRRSTRPNLH